MQNYIKKDVKTKYMTKSIRNPRITVITVCRNSARLLETTILNINSQEYLNKEFIIVDGASTDNTLDIINKYAEHIDKWVSEPDNGIYDAMNKGVQMASGEYCIFMNAGDTFASNNVLYRIFLEPNKADVIYGNVIKRDKYGNKYEKQAEAPHNSHRMFFCHQSALTRTECLREFPYDTLYTMSADFKLYKTLWRRGKKFCRLPIPISIFDTNGISNTSRSRGLEQNIAIVKEIDGLVDKIRLLPRLYFVYWMTKLRRK